MVCKKHNSVWLSLLLVLLCIWFPFQPAYAEEQQNESIDTSWYKTESVFFSLEDRADFLGFLTLLSQGITFENQSVVLLNDVDLEGISCPISGVFSGFFDGKGHTITHFTQSGQNVALFETLSGTSTVQNLSISEPSLQGEEQAAALALNVQSGACIRNCSVKDGTITAPMAGGLVVNATENVTVIHCENSATVSASQVAGGLVAQNNVTETEAEQKAMCLTTCVNHGNVSAGKTVGGLIGQADYLTLTHCLNYGKISLSSSPGTAGGLTGLATDVSMEDCSNNGSVTTTSQTTSKVLLGGLAGSAAGSISNVCNMSSGSIKNESTHTQSATGGLFGNFSAGKIEKARNLGPVEGKANTGGLVGSATYVAQEGYGFSKLENKATVQGEELVGGLFGSLSLEANDQTQLVETVLSKGANQGNIKGNRTVGGIIGNVSGSRRAMVESLLVDCMNLAQIEAEECAGGLIGHLSSLQISENNAMVQTSYHNGSVIATMQAGTMIGLNDVQGILFDHCASPKGKQMTYKGTASGVTELSSEDFHTDVLLSLLNHETDNIWSISDDGTIVFSYINEILSPSTDVENDSVVKHTYPLVLCSTAGASITYQITTTTEGKTETTEPQTVTSGESISLSKYPAGTEIELTLTAQQEDSDTTDPVTIHLQIQAVQPLTITGLSLSSTSRVYDGTNTIALQGTPSLMGAITEGDDIHVEGTAFGRFLDKDAGTGKVVSVQGISLVGADADYYTLITPIFTADIVRRPLTLQNVTIADKGYDGTATANVSNIDLVGVLEGESVSVDYLNAKAAFISPDKGENVPAFVTNLQLEGADSQNYSLMETTAMATGRIVTMPSIERSNTAQTGQCSISIDGLDSVMPSMLCPGENGTVVVYATANDISLPENAKTEKDQQTQSLMAIDLQLKQAYKQEETLQSESSLPPGMLTSPLTVHFTFATNDKNQTFQLTQMNAAGELISLETQTQTQTNGDGTVTLTAQTQTMGTFVIQGTKQDTSTGTSFATVLPYILLFIIVVLIVFAGQRTKGSKA